MPNTCMRNLAQTDQNFRALAHQISDFCADFITSLPELPVFPPDVTGRSVEELFAKELPREGLGATAFDLLPEVFRFSKPPSPRFFGYVFGSGEPIGALGAFAASVLHQNVTAWRSGPAAMTIERTVVRWLAEAIGCAGFSGSLTLGGSLANLMGLCMARDAKLSGDEKGLRTGVIYCSVEAHMSIHKAASLLGIGSEGVRSVAVDEDFRMRPDILRESIEDDLRKGLRPIAVVATAGTTSTGSIDPLSALADICAEFELWLHIDGAYGAIASLAVPELFDGIERADSVSLDPHKWLYQPTGCGCLLYRDPSAARRSFSYSDEYAHPLSHDPIEGFAIFEESIELSRPFRALSLWLSLQYHGLKALAESIREDLHLARLLAASIDTEPHIELLAPVELSVVCFRYRNSSKDLNELNQAILNRVLSRGRVYLSNTSIRGKFALRACIVNHRSSEEDVRMVVTEVLAAASEIQA